jgi:hypothetical protein
MFVRFERRSSLISNGVSALFFSNKEEGLFLISELGPFLTLGHSSYTNQSAPWTECINPKECLSLDHSSPWAIPPTLIKVHPGENV